jgi:hypothetical protein
MNAYTSSPNTFSAKTDVIGMMLTHERVCNYVVFSRGVVAKSPITARS